VAEPVRAHIRRPADRCYARFCDMRLLPAWMPNLRKAKVVRSDADGRALEVLFHFGDRLTYSLVYSYDPSRRRIEWAPGVGRRDAVRGGAEFADEAGECAMTYQLEPTGDRPADERTDDGPMIVDAFVHWIESESTS
jgi:hypothetical protein